MMQNRKRAPARTTIFTSFWLEGYVPLIIGETGIFDQFSNMKSVLKKSSKPELTLLYPPYTDKKEKIYRKFV